MDTDTAWQPNETFVQAMISMGIDKNAAEEALFCTGNESIELAVNYLYNSPPQDESTAAGYPCGSPPQAESIAVNYVPDSPPQDKSIPVNYVCNPDKSSDALRPRGPMEPDTKTKTSETNVSEEGYKMVFVVNTALKMGLGKLAAQVAHACLGLYRDMCDKDLMALELFRWQFVGEKKVVLKGNDHNHLQELHDKAKECNVPCYLIHDAGRTQIPANSMTVLSLFGLEEDVDYITGTLSLL